MQPLLLKGKAAIITGSSRGIGKAIATAFALHGASLVIHGTSAEKLIALKNQLGPEQCEYISGDISELETSKRLAEKCLEAFGKIDILVNNAGINTRTKFLELSPEEWERVLKINLTGTFYACQSVAPHMIEKNSGVIINMSSSAGKTPHASASLAYGVSKGGIDAMTRQLAFNLAPFNIRVNSISPGPIETDMSLQWSPDYREKILKDIPLRRLGKDSDVAELAVFLASDLSSFITGESININGGKYMN